MGQKEEKKKNTWAFALSPVHITKLREGVVSGVPLNFLKHQDCAFCALLAARLSRLKQRLNLTQSCMRVDKAVSELYRASSEFTEAASESPEAWAVFCFWLIVEGLRGAACPYFSLSHFPDNISHAHAFLFLRIIEEMRARPFLFLRIIEQMHAHTFSHNNNITHTMMCPETQHTHRGTEPLQKRLSSLIAPIFRSNRYLEKLRS
jgi:hypothetical protein